MGGEGGLTGGVGMGLISALIVGLLWGVAGVNWRYKIWQRIASFLRFWNSSFSQTP